MDAPRDERWMLSELLMPGDLPESGRLMVPFIPPLFAATIKKA
jgi:hypothetical protein